MDGRLIVSLFFAAAFAVIGIYILNAPAPHPAIAMRPVDP